MAHATRPCRECGEPLGALGKGFTYHPACKLARSVRSGTKTKTCVGCGQEFSYRASRGTDRAYCTSQCRGAVAFARSKTAEARLPECGAGGCSRRVRSSGSPWCEMHYYRLRRSGQLELPISEANGRPGRTPTPCVNCGTLTTGRRKFCSSLCWGRHRHGVEWAGRECLTCRKPIHASDHLLRKYCGPLCSERASKLRRYGITPAEYSEMHAAQGGQCAICGSDDRLVVDHRHHDGIVRGLLCGQCNVGLGMFAESADRLQAAVAYLRSDKDERTLGGLD